MKKIRMHSGILLLFFFFTHHWICLILIFCHVVWCFFHLHAYVVYYDNNDNDVDMFIDVCWWWCCCCSSSVCFDDFKPTVYAEDEKGAVFTLFLWCLTIMFINTMNGRVVVMHFELTESVRAHRNALHKL